MRKVILKAALVLLITAVYWFASAFVLFQTSLFEKDYGEFDLYICGTQLMEDTLKRITNVATLSIVIAIPLALITVLLIIPSLRRGSRHKAEEARAVSCFEDEEADCNTEFDD